MAISTAVQRGGMVQACDEQGRAMFSRAGNLHGYTGGTVSVSRGRWVYTYDDRGRQVSTRSQS